MDFKICKQCGKEIEGNGVLFRGKVFCGDECCDEYDDEFSSRDIPSLEDLNEDLKEEDESPLADTQEDLGYRDGDDLDDDLDDDDFNISNDDF